MRVKTALERLHRQPPGVHVASQPAATLTILEASEYNARYILGDEETGNFSDEAVITCAP